MNTMSSETSSSNITKHPKQFWHTDTSTSAFCGHLCIWLFLSVVSQHPLVLRCLSLWPFVPTCLLFESLCRNPCRTSEVLSLPDSYLFWSPSYSVMKLDIRCHTKENHTVSDVTSQNTHSVQ